MDTVSMLNKMSFYCQPILPLVYDESMSYYETLCKVVGQLNTTGDAVNKLNEGLTGEIADRQAADAELDERLKLIEATNSKIHFLVFDGANPNGGFPTRRELYQWVHEGDAIFTLFRTYEEGRGQIYAASCSYNAGNWGSEASNDFSIIVPLETSYDAAQDYAVRQKVAKLSIPLSPQTNLNVAWRLQIIEVNTPYTSADGVVNLVAVINDSDSVNCSITPSEFLGLYNTTRGGKNLCVAVNAKLAYDGLARSSSVATVDTTNRKIRIAFESDHGTFINNGVKQLNKTLDYIIGDANTNVWAHETIDSKTLDFTRYEGFQFTRGENNVITPNDESTPNAVYAQYHSDTSGKLYQNLPVRLIDTVDNAEYWNGVFDIKDDRHMTFTFVTSNYTAASGKMAVRVIELSADVNTTTWKYAEKEFELPISSSGEKYLVESTAISEGVYDAARKKTDYYLTFNKTNNEIISALNSGKDIQFKVTLTEGNDSYTTYFSVGYTRVDVFANVPVYMFVGSFGDLDHSVITVYGVTDSDETYRPYLTTTGGILPEPNPNDSDDGKVLAVNKHKWELKTPSGGGSPDAVLYTAQTLTDAQKKQARTNIDASSDFVTTITLDESTGRASADKTFAEISAAASAGKRVFAIRQYEGVAAAEYYQLTAYSPAALIFSQVIAQGYDLYAYTITISADNRVIWRNVNAVALNSDESMSQQTMASNPTADMQIATKKYVDDHSGGGSSVTVDTAMSDTSANAVQNKVIKKYVDDHSSSASTKVTLVGNIEGEVEGYTSTTFQQIKDEIAKNRNIWLTINGETVRLASYKTSYNQSVVSDYKLVFFGAGDGSLTVKYEVTASASSASLTVTGS